ncbi:hypothetical protein PROFUN_08500 [Planoprotostelium fungivorum]|uniref:Uncharacterized protein n=1 Tax=Planoprotostelium fungivorum TaxID=1890364 RepID=A0A2P6NJA3_9EUKA|nr:hypothetical protein PROFUN_08500 [Planoprotostelium fungivorum]
MLCLLRLTLQNLPITEANSHADASSTTSSDGPSSTAWKAAAVRTLGHKAEDVGWAAQFQRLSFSQLPATVKRSRCASHIIIMPETMNSKIEAAMRRHLAIVKSIYGTEDRWTGHPNVMTEYEGEGYGSTLLHGCSQEQLPVIGSANLEECGDSCEGLSTAVVEKTRKRYLAS